MHVMAQPGCTPHFRYDGTVASYLPWSPGAPLGGSNTVVQLVSPGYTVEDTEPRMTRLICKTPAAYVAYDGWSEFKRYGRQCRIN